MNSAVNRDIVSGKLVLGLQKPVFKQLEAACSKNGSRCKA